MEKPDRIEQLKRAFEMECESDISRYLREMKETQEKIDCAEHQIKAWKEQLEKCHFFIDRICKMKTMGYEETAAELPIIT